MNQTKQILNSLTKSVVQARLRELWGLPTYFLVFFSAPIILLYVLAPLPYHDFEIAWKGRFPYLIFIWLVFLETILSGHKLAHLDIITKLKRSNVRFALGLVFLFAPTLVALWESVGNGQHQIALLGRLVGTLYPEWADWLLAFEYTLFALFFILSVWLLQNRKGLRCFQVSSFFIGGMATFLMIDAFYRAVWFFQILVQPIVTLAAYFLKMLGYHTFTANFADGYLLSVMKAEGHPMTLLIYWPCAGVHSMVIYVLVVLLFLRNIDRSPRMKIVYIAIGAIGTFMANIFRIVSIGVIGANTGPEAANLFHAYYSELYFLVWIAVYLIAVSLYESHHRHTSTKALHAASSSPRREYPTLSQTTIGRLR